MGWLEAATVRALNPRVKTALRLHTVGAVKTVKEASRIAGIDRHYMSQLRCRSPLVKAYVKKLEDDIDAGAVNMSSTMQELGRRGVQRIAELMESDEVKDDLRLRAAIDLADRSPETSKTNKLSIESDLTLREGDAKALIAALVEAAQVTQEFRKEVEVGDYVKVDDGSHLLPPGPQSEA
jgi:methanogenic corrinoid protein MtbC1